MKLQQQAQASYKNYDIRGVTGQTITKELAYATGNAFARKYGLKSCLVGRDPRRGAKELHDAFSQGLTDAGCSVVDSGVASTSMLKWAAKQHDFDGLAITTASHNPPKYCGFKLYSPANIAIYEGAGLHELKAHLDDSVTVDTPGSVEFKSFHEEYVDFLLDLVAPSAGKVFIDPSGGAASKESKVFAEKSGLEVTLYNAQEDPEFSVHPADPTMPEALEAAKDFCAINDCLGFVFDGDCDRVAIIDENGKSIFPDAWAAWYISQTLKPGITVAGAIGTTEALRTAVSDADGEFVLSVVGHPHVQRAVRENHAHLGAERSGHIYFPQTHDGEAPLLVILETLKLLDGTKLSDAILPFTEDFMRENQNVRVVDPDVVIEAANDFFSAWGEVSRLDGVYVHESGWWVSVRKSNTEPLVRIKYESNSKDQFEKIKSAIDELIKPYLDESKEGLSH